MAIEQENNSTNRGTTHASHKKEAETAGNTNGRISGLAAHTATKTTSRYSVFNRESIRLLYSVKPCDELTMDPAHPPVIYAFTSCLDHFVSI